MKNKIILKLASRNLIKIKDEEFIKMKYFHKMKKPLNLEKPVTFNEKLQWLKLYDRNPEYTKMVDKYEAKKYIADIVGEEYIIPTLGVWDKFEDINFEKLPNQFVLKCTHDSGGLVVCKDKTRLNIEETRKKINKCLKRNYYYTGREWPYKNVKPRIIAEEYIGSDLTDYRLYCFNGKPIYTYVYTNVSQKDGSKPEPSYCNIYDENWTKQKFRNKCIATDTEIKQPEKFQEMQNISKKISKNKTFLRVDFYIVDEKLYVGELTFFPGAGFSKFFPEEQDKIIGDMLELPNNKREENNAK